jgi:uncharacterized lipoprotein YddW (UPF0748 family)
MMPILSFCLVMSLFIGFHPALYAQTLAPKREFRGVWIASVSNIDFPLRSSDSPEKQRADYIAILETHRQLGINAVFVQVRPASDAFYANSREPWSEWLTGAQGRAPEPAWDPLQFMLEEAHKRNMEFHAWFNPFRSVVSSSSRVADNHISRLQPAWHLAFGSPFRLLNPGLPEVRAYVLSVIMDVVRRYDIDGVHFDDYFYPYEGTTTQDAATFAQFPRGFSTIADWRRDNVNIFVKAVSDSIRAVKRHVKFGISPFGIWRSGTPQGIVGLDAYSVIYCDARAWLQAGTVDYIIPQLYWKFGGGQDYARLMPWWLSEARAAGRHLYTGLGAYRLTDAAWTAEDLTRQVDFNREQRAEGAVWFSSNGLTRNLKGIQTSLQANQYTRAALPPTMPWKDSIPALPPTFARGESPTQDSLVIRWQPSQQAQDGERAHRYVIYNVDARAVSGLNVDVNTPETARIIGITRDTVFRFFGKLPFSSFAVTALDRLQNESRAELVRFLTSNVAVSGTLQPLTEIRTIAPNPASDNVSITFSLARTERVRLTLTDNLGRIIATILDEDRPQGEHSCAFDAHSLASGVYAIRLETGGTQRVKMLVVQKH